MSHEILYTSAPQGLKPGSYGFCSVLATEGIPKALQDRLESLSGYEHAFALTDRRSHLNPINFSHLIVTVANQRYHLLSRVADAGADYSGRSNKIAHHVACLPNELTPCGPAGALSAPNFCKTSFDGEPHLLPTGVPLPSTGRGLAPCNAWRELTGDAGWAGALAEMTIKYPTRPITLIFKNGTDLLPLVAEAFSLLPIDKQWRTTFSTYFTKLPAGIDCQWRFVLDGTPAADTARRNLQAPPIDLTARPPLPFEGDLVTAARTGQLAVTQATAAATKSAPPPRTAGPAAAVTPSSQPVKNPESGTYGLAQSPSRHAPSTPSHYRRDELFTARPSSSKYQLVGAIVGGIILLAVVFGMFGTSKQSPPPPTNIGTAENPNPARPTPIAKKEELPAELLAVSKEAPPPPKPVEPPKMEVAVATTNTKPPETKVDLKPDKPLPPPFTDIEKKGRLLSLPKRVGGLGAADSESGELCKIHVRDPAECELTLVTSETEDGQPRIFLQPDEAAAKRKRVWIATARVGKGLGGKEETVRIGTFQLANQTLTFEWNLAAPSWANPHGLTLCTLHVKVADESVPCALFKVVPSKPVGLNLAQGNQAIRFEDTGQRVASGSPLRLTVEFRFGDWSEVLNLTANADSKTVVVIPKEIDHGKGNVELELRFVPPSQNQDAELKYGAFPFLPTATEPSVPPKTVPEWVFKDMRTDRIRRPSSTEPVYAGEFKIADFVRVRQPLVKQKKDTEGKINNVQKPLEEAELRLKRAENVKSEPDIKEAQKEVAYWKGMRSHAREFDRYLDDLTAWSVEMEKHFQDLQKNLEVRYSMYLEFRDETVVLSETDPPPKRGDRKPATANEAKTDIRPPNPNF